MAGLGAVLPHMAGKTAFSKTRSTGGVGLEIRGRFSVCFFTNGEHHRFREWLLMYIPYILLAGDQVHATFRCSSGLHHA